MYFNYAWGGSGSVNDFFFLPIFHHTNFFLWCHISYSVGIKGKRRGREVWSPNVSDYPHDAGRRCVAMERWGSAVKWRDVSGRPPQQNNLSTLSCSILARCADFFKSNYSGNLWACIFTTLLPSPGNCTTAVLHPTGAAFNQNIFTSYPIFIFHWAERGTHK